VRFVFYCVQADGVGPTTKAVMPVVQLQLVPRGRFRPAPSSQKLVALVDSLLMAMTLKDHGQYA
jgi:hypothetical protein